MKIMNDDGQEIEVYTAEEVTAAKTAVEEEYKTKLQMTEKERDEARTSLGERAHEFAQFRKLSDEQVKQLNEKDRIIYENSLALQQEREKSAAIEKQRLESQIDSIIRSKVGNDEKAFTKVKEMWSVIGIDAQTPDAIENKTKMILGAISTTEPNLLANVSGFSNGVWAPPQTVQKDGEIPFSETERGKAAAAELGLKLEVDKK